MSEALISRRGGGNRTLNIVCKTALPDKPQERTVVIIAPETSTVTMSDKEPQKVNGAVWVQIEYTEGFVGADGSSGIKLLRALLYEGYSWQMRDAYYEFNGSWTQFSFDNVIFGYEWDFGNPSPALKRLENAVGLTATAGVGTVAGVSDFDNMPIYKDIRRCNLATNGAVNAYEGDANFKYDGTNGDVMVEIPKIYYKVEYDSSDKKRRHFISVAPAEGFKVHPAFSRPEGERDNIYVAAYQADAAYISRSGVASVQLANDVDVLGDWRPKVRAKGSGWNVLDFAARMLINELILTEFANNNVQAVIGPGNTSNTTALNTGRTDGISGHTGREAGADASKLSVVWRGIENWWGNLWETVDGIYFTSSGVYYCLDPSAFTSGTSVNYTKLSYARSNSNAKFGTALGYDSVVPWLALPTEFDSGGSSSTFLCDATWMPSADSTVRLVNAGGDYKNGDSYGLFTYACDSVSTHANTPKGCRMMYYPSR